MAPGFHNKGHKGHNGHTREGLAELLDLCVLGVLGGYFSAARHEARSRMRAGFVSYCAAALTAGAVCVAGPAARGESLAAFGAPNAAAALGTPFDVRCIPASCVAPRSNTPGIFGRRALPAGRVAALGATADFHHGLLVSCPRSS